MIKEKGVKLVKPKWKAGKERAFMKFISNIGTARSILLSHVQDLDGVVSAKAVMEGIHPNTLKFVDYVDLDMQFIEKLRKEKYGKIILSDLYIKNRELIREMEKFADILIIDHHPVQDDYNSKRTVFMNADGYSAAYLCYYLFSKIRDLKQLEWLVLSASISDFCYTKGKKWISSTYTKYGDNFQLDRGFARKQGIIWDLVMDLSLAISYFKPKTERVYSSIGRNFGDIGDLKKFSDAVRNEINVTMQKFEREKIPFKEGYFFYFECIFPIRSYLSTEISLKMKDKLIIIAEKKGDYVTLSARRQDGKVNLNNLIPKLIKGFENSGAGGHKASVGGNFPAKYLDEFRKRLKNL